MRSGFTTGSAACAAASAATCLLLTGRKRNTVSITTPKGVVYSPEVIYMEQGNGPVSCGVIKDSGDDPDVTNGATIIATVEIMENYLNRDELQVEIDGGIGIGRVSKPGLDQPVGNAAINHVPREMITAEVKNIAREADFHGVIRVVISCPEGEELARRTFNPRLGIIGGISIIGTSGIVEPMSMDAIKKTILVELRQQKALGYSIAAITPGNYGRDYLLKTYGYDLDRSVKCSNFIGDTIDMAVELGFEKLVLTGHIGKLVKVSGGMMNTHSREGDCRMELLAAAAVENGADLTCIKEILGAVTTEEGVKILNRNGILEGTMNTVLNKILMHLSKRGGDRIQIECILYANDYGELARSREAIQWLTLLAQEQAQLI